MIAKASSGEAKVGAPYCGAARCVVAVQRRRRTPRGSRRGAPPRAGPAPMISHEQRLRRRRGRSASVSRNARTPAAHALLVGGVALGVDAVGHRAHDLGRGLVEQREDALLLVGEVLVERRLRHARLARDRLGARLGVADAREDVRRGLEQAPALHGRGAPPAAARGGRGGRSGRDARQRPCARMVGSAPGPHAPSLLAARLRSPPSRSPAAPRQTTSKRLVGQVHGRAAPGRQHRRGLRVRRLQGRPGTRSAATLLRQPLVADLRQARRHVREGASTAR